ncbi:NUDIX domain-containing protein, partial [Roseovarius pacificus]|uniref:NUDIX hydrolase n=1 Tax=Roseovarius pacificus TaxID=337701 RepID=UPI00374A03FF
MVLWIWDEDLRTAALRELKEETGAVESPAVHLEQFHTFGAVDRDPRQRTISVVYLALAPSEEVASQNIQAADDAADVQWWPVNQLPELAFDHAQIMGC